MFLLLIISREIWKSSNQIDFCWTVEIFSDVAASSRPIDHRTASSFHYLFLRRSASEIREVENTEEVPKNRKNWSITYTIMTKRTTKPRVLSNLCTHVTDYVWLTYIIFPFKGLTIFILEDSIFRLGAPSSFLPGLNCLLSQNEKKILQLYYHPYITYSCIINL